MKKILCTFLISIMILTVLILPAAATDKEVVDLAVKFGIEGELVITEILSNTKCDNGGKTIGNDYCEFFEVMNISAREIDMYDYFIWYNDSSRGNYFFCEPGQWLLAPGEVALVISFFSDHFSVIVSSGDSTEPWIKYNADGTRTHNIDAWLEFAKSYYFWGENLLSDEAKNIKIFFTDRTDNTGENNGNQCTIGSGFNLGNSGATYYIGRRGEDIDKAYCSAQILSASNNRATTFGPPEAGSKELSVYEFDYADPTPGYLNEDQYDLWYGEQTTETTTTEPETTTAPEATTPEVTTTAEVTEKPDTTPAETTTTKDTEAPEKEGCGSTAAASAIISAVALAAMVLLKGRKRLYTE